MQIQADSINASGATLNHVLGDQNNYSIKCREYTKKVVKGIPQSAVVRLCVISAAVGCCIGLGWGLFLGVFLMKS